MKKITKYMITLLLIITVSITALVITKKNVKEVAEENDLINIFDLSDEFMETYYDDMEEMNSYEDQENILIVTAKEGLTEYYGASNVVEGPNHQYFIKYDSEEERTNALKQFSNLNGVAAEENIIYEPCAYNSWGVVSEGFDTASAFVETFPGKRDVTVAVIDTGLNIDLFLQKYPTKLAGTMNLVKKGTTVTDSYGHGTHVSGTIAEATPSNVNVYVFKAAEVDKLSSSAIIEAINYITSNKVADVINMSYGSYYYSEATHTAIEAAKKAKIISVAAAGNDNTSNYHYPSGYDNTISIAAVDSSLNRATFSNFGSNVTFAAPGVNIVSINGTKKGTSMAAPHVSSAVAILKSLNKDYTMEEIIEILKKYAVDLGDPGWDEYYGYGYVSLKNVPFCDGTTKCDSKGIFKIEEATEEELTSIEIESDNLTDYTFQNETNLMTFKIKYNYSYNGQEYSYSKYAGEIDDLVIEGYDPLSTDTQTVTFTTMGQSVSHEITQTEDFLSRKAFMYEIYGNEEATMLTITGYNEQTSSDPLRKIIIPEMYEESYVIRIAENAFKNKLQETYEITIPLPAQIDDYAFYGTKLKTVKTIISQTLFDDLKARNIGVPEEFILSSFHVDMNNYAFAENHDLKIFEGKIAKIGAHAFENCYQLESTIEVATLEGESSIGEYAFSNCRNLKQINMPYVESIGQYAFYQSGLTSVNIPGTIKNIPTYAFGKCNALTNVTFNEGLESISDYAFRQDIGLKELSFPSTLKSVTVMGFYEDKWLQKISVADANPYFDDRGDMLVKTSTNTIVIGRNGMADGSWYVEIPATITAIGSAAFRNLDGIMTIETNDELTTIGKNAFIYSKLNNLLVNKNVTSIGDNAFTGLTDFTMYIVGSDVAREYAKTNNVNYISLDPSVVRVDLKKTSYKIGETVKTSDIEMYTEYDNTERKTVVYTTGFTIKYPSGGKKLAAGDTSIEVSVENEYGYVVTGIGELTVAKNIPTYTIPSGLKGNLGSALSTITLPSGWTWMNPDEVMTEPGSQTFKGRYTPSNTTTYEIMENIDIPVNVTVTKTVIEPEISISPKEYDGLNTVDSSKITISNLLSNEYTIVSATSTSTGVGNTKVSVTVKLTNAKYVTHEFSGETQQKTFEVDMEIIPKKLKKPTAVVKTYTYTSVAQTYEFTNFDSTKMNVSNNTRTNAGNQTVTLSLKDKTNYTWEDGTTDDLTYTFTIDKADPTYDLPSGLTGATKNKLSTVNLPENWSWMNHDEVISTPGVQTFKAKYTPTDTDNYNILTNINVSVTVTLTKEVVAPTVSVSSLTFNNSLVIDKSKITVSELTSSEYTIVSATLDNVNAGTRTASITLRLSDSKFATHAFEGNVQEKTFTKSVTVAKAKLNKPTAVDKKYTYNTNEQTYELDNFDESKMNVTNNKRTEAGSQTVTVSLKDKTNYTWNDGTNTDLTFNFEILKAKLPLTDNSKDVVIQYDGIGHTIEIDIDFRKIELPTLTYEDEDGNYTLSKAPLYTEIGTYVVKYKVSLSNYQDYYGQKTLKIVNNVIKYTASDKSVEYDGNNHTISLEVTTPNHTIRYSVNNTNYDLEELPTFKEVGEYKIYYKIAVPEYEDIKSYNTVKIYGVKQVDESLIIKEKTFASKANSFEELITKIDTFSTSTDYKHYDKNNNLVTNNTIKTGDILKININGNKIYEYKLSYLGDASGDGKINYMDYVVVYNHIYKTKHADSDRKLLENEYFIAGDMSEDGKINYMDYVKIYNKIKEDKGGSN